MVKPLLKDNPSCEPADNAAQGQCSNEGGWGGHNDRPLAKNVLEKRFHAASLDAGSRPARVRLTTRFLLGLFFKLTQSPLDSEEQKRNNVLLMFTPGETGMLKVFVEEAAALASISLFVGMIAVWAQLIPQL